MEGTAMGDRLRLGIIGTSGWTELMYFNNLKGRDDVEIAAISGRTPGRLAEMAGKHGIAKTYTDYRELVADPDIDAVVVAAPDDQHLEMTLAAIDRRLDVLCEKPLANSAADARRMLDAAERKGIKHMMLFTWRWQPHFQWLKKMIDAGEFGRVYRAQFAFVTGFARNNDYTWRHDPHRANGVLGDLGSHMIELSQWFFGDVESVSATLGVSIPRTHIKGHEHGSGNDSAHLSLRFKNGTLGVVDVTVVSHTADMLVKQIVRLETENGTFEIDHIFTGELAGTTIRSLRADDDKVRLLKVPPEYFGKSDPANFLDVYNKERVGVLDFVHAIREDRRPEPGFDVGVRVQEVVDAAFMSDREGRRVDL
jgi:predicted dehydrogenase